MLTVSQEACGGGLPHYLANWSPDAKGGPVLSQKTRCFCPLFTGSLIPGPSISQMNLIQSTGTSCRGTGSKGLELALGNPMPGSTSLISLGSLPGPWQLLGARYFVSSTPSALHCFLYLAIHCWRPAEVAVSRGLERTLFFPEDQGSSCHQEWPQFPRILLSLARLAGGSAPGSHCYPGLKEQRVASGTG